MERKTFREWIKIKEAIGGATDVVMGHGCPKDGEDYQIAGDPCASKRAEKHPTGILLNDKKKQKK